MASQTQTLQKYLRGSFSSEPTISREPESFITAEDIEEINKGIEIATSENHRRINAGLGLAGRKIAK